MEFEALFLFKLDVPFLRNLVVSIHLCNRLKSVVTKSVVPTELEHT